MKKLREKAKIDPNAWMLTFSDLLTLLLTFFVLLLSMSSMNDLKLREAFGALKGAVGVLEFGKESGVNTEEFVSFSSSSAKSQSDLMRLFEEMRRALDVGEAETLKKTVTVNGTEIEVRSDNRGAVIALPEMALFAPGSAELGERGEELLSDIGRVLMRSSNVVSVDGHTDDRPPASAPYPTGWELSMARALSVVHYLVEEANLLPQRFVASGYGPNQPMVANDTSAGRERNRRVEIVLLKDRTFWR